MSPITEEVKPKSYWGHGIVVVYALFMTMILTIVFISSDQKMELVSGEYYNEGIDYQQVIDSRANVAALQEKPNFTQSNMSITAPSSLNKEFISATVTLYRPNDSTLDQTISIPAAAESFTIPELKNGSWQIYLRWQDTQNKNYEMQWNIYK
ncbi:MAG: FixH family protein [Lentisphaeraceae bacterium]|nr:FixH family protein [Lentisphaeraceae bacterium]